MLTAAFGRGVRISHQKSGRICRVRRIETVTKTKARWLRTAKTANKANASLDHGARDFGYAVFAKVIDGMDVVDKIAAVTTGTKGHFQDVPVEPVVIQSAKRVEE